MLTTSCGKRLPVRLPLPAYVLRKTALALLCAPVLLVAQPKPHAELAALYAADQADRRPENLLGLAPARRDSVMFAVMSRDTVRRARVEALMKQGVAQVAADYFHAAIVLQHGRDTSATLLAHTSSRRAVELDSTHMGAMSLIASSWDQLQYGRGRPQWYGTLIIGGLREPARLYDIDTTKVTDAQRKRMGSSNEATEQGPGGHAVRNPSAPGSRMRLTSLPPSAHSWARCSRLGAAPLGASP